MRVVLFTPLLGLAACSFEGASTYEGAVGGSGGAQLLVPEDVELHWDASFNGENDGRAALVPVDVMLYDGSSGDPLADEALTVETVDGAGIVDPEVVDPVNPMLGVEGEGNDAIWDVWRDRYVALVGDAPPLAHLATDRYGVARFYVFVDAFPPASALDSDSTGDSTDGGEDTGFGPVPVVVSLHETDDTFLLVPR